MKDKDVDAAIELTDEPCIITCAQGVGLIDRAAYASMMENATWEILDVDIHDDVQVRINGDPVTIDAADTSAWVRRDGRWFYALHTESIAGDPFGRDRHAS